MTLGTLIRNPHRIYKCCSDKTTNNKDYKMIQIETDRIFLRKFTLNDVVDLSMVLSDPQSMVHYSGAFSSDKVKHWINRNIERYESDGYGLWAMIRKSDNAFLGDCGITNQIINGAVHPEIGFHVIKKYCNCGYATEAALGCKNYAFDKLKLSKIYSYTRVENLASRRVSEKIGMVEISRFISNGHEQVLYCAEKI